MAPEDAAAAAPAAADAEDTFPTSPPRTKLAASTASSQSSSAHRPRFISASLLQHKMGNAPSWKPDDDTTACHKCRSNFTTTRRRHHCRHCGEVFCASCSSHRLALQHQPTKAPVRVCDTCFGYINLTRNPPHQRPEVVAALRELVGKEDGQSKGRVAESITAFLRQFEGGSAKSAPPEPPTLRQVREFMDASRDAIVQLQRVSLLRLMEEGESAPKAGGEADAAGDESPSDAAWQLEFELQRIIDQVLEERVVLPLREALLSRLTAEMYEEELQLELKIAEVRGKPQAFFDIQPDLASSSKWGACIAQFNAIRDEIYPSRMLRALLQTAKSVYELHESEHRGPDGESPPPLSGDDLLPVMCYIIAHADVVCLTVLVEFMMSLCDSISLNGEAGYYVTVTCAGVEHIKRLEAEEIARWSELEGEGGGEAEDDHSSHAADDSNIYEGKVSVTFTEPGSIGIKVFGHKDGGNDDGIKVREVTAGTQAASFPQLRPGMTIRTIQGQRVAGLPFREFCSYIKSGIRPLTLTLDDAQPDRTSISGEGFIARSDMSTMLLTVEKEGKLGFAFEKVDPSRSAGYSVRLKGAAKNSLAAEILKRVSSRYELVLAVHAQGSPRTSLGGLSFDESVQLLSTRARPLTLELGVGPELETSSAQAANAAIRGGGGSGSSRALRPNGASEPVAASWRPDEQSKQCSECERAFSIKVRRHHCRHCGQVFCGTCAKGKMPISHLHITEKVRVCGSCASQIRSIDAANVGAIAFDVGAGVRLDGAS